MTNPIQFDQKQERILSVDFFRGLTMFLLIGESTELYSHIQSIQGSSIMQFLGTQLSHHEWNGLHFWDLIQPFFMFIVGVAIPFAVANRKKKGDSDKKILIACPQTFSSAAFLRMGTVLYGAGQNSFQAPECSGTAISYIPCCFPDNEKKLLISAHFHSCQFF